MILKISKMYKKPDSCISNSIGQFSLFLCFRARFDKELPFLTETGAAGFDAIYRHHCETLRLIEPSVLVPSDNKLSMRALVASALNLLLGVPSRNFTYNVVSE